MVNKIQNKPLIRTVYACLNNIIHGVVVILMWGEISKQYIILMIFKCCVSKFHLIGLMPNLKLTYDQIDQMDKFVTALY